jgi:hypothetical protein
MKAPDIHREVGVGIHIGELLYCLLVKYVASLSVILSIKLIKSTEIESKIIIPFIINIT